MPPTEKMATESDHREVRSSWETALPLLSDSVLLKNFRMICKRKQVARVTIQREAFYSVESRYYCPPSASMKTERHKGSNKLYKGTEGGAFTEKQQYDELRGRQGTQRTAVFIKENRLSSEYFR